MPTITVTISAKDTGTSSTESLTLRIGTRKYGKLSPPRHARPWTKDTHEQNRDVGKTMPKEERDKGLERIGIYGRWFKDTILTHEHSNALIVLPIESVCPRYRDEPPTSVPYSRKTYSLLLLNFC